VRRYRESLADFQWAAIQDWMCEPWILQKTGLSVAAHQALSVASLLELRDRAPEIAWAPVLQGWTEADYLRHVDMYAASGVDLRQESIVGIGSVCRRQGTYEALSVCRALHALGLRLHGFGVKTNGLRLLVRYLVSADSMAWSYDARRKPTLCGSQLHKNCANCLRFALRWREQLLEYLRQALEPPRKPAQMRLW